MIRQLVIGLLILFLGGCAKPSVYTTEKINEEVKKRTATIILRKADTLSLVNYSTGFFIEYNKTKYCITTAHILYDAVKEGYNKADLKVEVLLNDRYVSMKSFLITAEDDEIDIWIFKSTQEVEDVPAFLMSESSKEISLLPGADIIFCGFPEVFKIGNKLSFTYMTRKCIIAARSFLSVRDLRSIYIIDALVNPGDSGSPVVNLSNAELVGFVKGFRYNPKAPTRELGLGGVIPISYVLEIIDSTY